MLDLKSFEKYKNDISKKHFDLLKECKKERNLIRKIESFDFDVSLVGEDFDDKIVLFSPYYSIMNDFKVETRKYDSKIYTMYQESFETIMLNYYKVFQFYRNINSKVKVILKDNDLEKNNSIKFEVFHGVYPGISGCPVTESYTPELRLNENADPYLSVAKYLVDINLFPTDSGYLKAKILEISGGRKIIKDNELIKISPLELIISGELKKK